MIRRVMIDLETLGTKPGCVVLEIGIVTNYGAIQAYRNFNLSPMDLKILASHGDEIGLSIPVDIGQQGKESIDPSTLRWWMAHRQAFDRIITIQATGSVISPEMAGSVVAKALKDAEEVWANSPSFDLAILSDWLPRHGFCVPWRYWQERDFRTVVALNPSVPYERPADAHSALADAMAQAAHLDRLGIWRS
jgi:hypothetical protein